VLNHLVLTGELPQGDAIVITMKLEALKKALVKVVNNASLIPDINMEVDVLTEAKAKAQGIRPLFREDAS
jgi:hypothetical protein